LEGDLVDHADDVRDLAACRVDLAHGADRTMHDGTALLCLLARTDSKLIRLSSVIRVLLHGSSHLLHAGCGLLERCGLLLRTLRQIVVAERELPRRRADRIRAGA